MPRWNRQIAEKLDNLALVAAIDRLGYTGSIGVLGWDYGGDVYLKLERSLHTMHDISRRLDRHRAWGLLPLR